MRWTSRIIIALHASRNKEKNTVIFFDNMSALDALRQQTRTKGNTYRIWLRIKD